MKYVNAFMMPNSKLLAVIALFGVPISDMLYKDRHGNNAERADVNPSAFITWLARFAVVLDGYIVMAYIVMANIVMAYISPI